MSLLGSVVAVECTSEGHSLMPQETCRGQVWCVESIQTLKADGDEKGSPIVTGFYIKGCPMRHRLEEVIRERDE